MFDKTMSAKFSIWRTVSLVSMMMFAAGCTEQESKGSAERSTEDATLEHTETSRKPANVGTAFIGKTMDAPRRSGGCGTQDLAPGVHRLSMEHGGWDRNFTIAVPDSATSRSLAYPLLIAMHGFGGSGAGMRQAIGLHSGFEGEHVVLYPDGAASTNSLRGWNSGHPDCCGTALDNNVDDVAFLRALVDSVAQVTCIDLNRVYATGFSNGGDMAQRLACDASDVVAAVTSVAGRFDYHASACPGDRPVPAALYRGHLDRTVPYKANLLSPLALKTIPAIEGFEQIARNHKCRGTSAKTLSTEDTDCIRFDDCDDGFEITLCTGAGAGHCWPGLGSCSRTRQGDAEEFSASNHMRDFFSRHALSP